MKTSAFVGVIPAAGIGSRLGTLKCPKEIVPIAYYNDPLTGEIQPVLAAELAMRAIADAGVQKCLMVVSDRKPEFIRYFGDGSTSGLSLAYVIQQQPSGLALAVDTAFEWIKDSNVCFALPDTVFTPSSALAEAKALFLSSDADLVLGVFPTDRPQHLGPVEIDVDDRVVEVQEKPSSTAINNTWGIAVWSPKFSSLLHSLRAELLGQSIGFVFNEAIKTGLRVRAISFDSGSYLDLGTGKSLGAFVAMGSVPLTTCLEIKS